MTQTFDVFISYKREERALAEQVAAALEAAGYTQVTDLNLQNGDHFGDAIDRMIRAARAVLILWTPASANSQWVKNEARLGVELGTYLGVMVEATDLPVDLKYLQHEDLAGTPLAQALPRVVGAVTAAIGPPSITPQIAASQSTGLNDDLRLFETAERLDTVAAYAAYLEAFPGGVMATVARKRERDRKTVAWRVRRMLPNAAIIGALAGLGALFLQAFFSDEADAYFERQAKLRAAQNEAARLSTQLEAAPDAGELDEARQKVTALEQALDARPDPEGVNRLQRERDTLRDRLAEAQKALREAPDPEELAEVQQRVEQLEQALAARPDPEDVTRLQRERDALKARLTEAEAELALWQKRAADTQTDLGRQLRQAKEQVEILQQELAGAADPEEPARPLNAAAPEAAPTEVTIPAPDCDADDGQRGYRLPKAGCVPLDATRLDLSQWDVTDADLRKVAGLKALQELWLSGTQVENIDALAGLTGLQTLWLTDTQVSTIDALAGLTRLQTLWLANTEVGDIDALAGLTGLQTLSLSGTQVENIDALASLTELQHLSLSNTQVENIDALAGLTGLQELYLGLIPIRDLSPLRSLTAMHYLRTPDDSYLGDLDDTPENRAEVRAWIEANT